MGRPFLEAAHRDGHEIGLPADVAMLICHYFVFPGNGLRPSRDQ